MRVCIGPSELCNFASLQLVFFCFYCSVVSIGVYLAIFFQIFEPLYLVRLSLGTFISFMSNESDSMSGGVGFRMVIDVRDEQFVNASLQI